MNWNISNSQHLEVNYMANQKAFGHKIENLIIEILNPTGDFNINKKKVELLNKGS
jgi:hypothetical protein